MTSKSKRREHMTRTKSQIRSEKRRAHFGGSRKHSHRVTIEGWDPKRTLLQNYKALGIMVDPNKEMISTKREKDKTPIVGLLTDRLVELQSLPKPEAYVVKSMSIQEQYRLQDLIRKHGDDYGKMSRDIKLNIQQDTAQQLKKRIALLRDIQDRAEEEAQEDYDALYEPLNPKKLKNMASTFAEELGDDMDDDMEEYEDMDEDMMEEDMMDEDMMEEDMEGDDLEEEEDEESSSQVDFSASSFVPGVIARQREMGIYLENPKGVQTKVIPVTKDAKVAREYKIVAPRLTQVDYKDLYEYTDVDKLLEEKKAVVAEREKMLSKKKNRK